MAKTRRLNLDRPYIYQGEFYGPGVTDVPIEDGAAASLEAKQAELLAKGISPIPVNEVNYEGSKPMIERLAGGQENSNATREVASRGGADEEDNMAPDKTVHTRSKHGANPEGQNPGGASDPEDGNVDENGGEQANLDEDAQEEAEQPAHEALAHQAKKNPVRKAKK